MRITRYLMFLDPLWSVSLSTSFSLAAPQPQLCSRLESAFRHPDEMPTAGRSGRNGLLSSRFWVLEAHDQYDPEPSRLPPRPCGRWRECRQEKQLHLEVERERVTGGAGPGFCNSSWLPGNSSRRAESRIPFRGQCPPCPEDLDLVISLSLF